MSIGEKLRALRKDKSLETVSKETGLTAQAIWNYEQNLRVPKDENKITLANYYKVSVQELFFEE